MGVEVETISPGDGKLLREAAFVIAITSGWIDFIWRGRCWVEFYCKLAKISMARIDSCLAAYFLASRSLVGNLTYRVAIWAKGCSNLLFCFFFHLHCAYKPDQPDFPEKGFVNVRNTHR